MNMASVGRPESAPPCARQAVRPHNLNIWRLTADGILTPNDVSASGRVNLHALANADGMRTHDDISPIVEDIRHEYTRLIALHAALQRRHAALEAHASRQERWLKALTTAHTTADVTKQ